MATLLFGPSEVILSSGLRWISLKSEHEVPVTVPDPLPVEGKSVQPQPESDVPPRILCGAFSPSGSLLAVCDDHKQMTVWKSSDRTLLRQWHVQRRANSVVFHGEDAILVADKTGDAHVFSVETDVTGGSGSLILGHLSMLLDVAVSSCGKFVITCDRDEKIRVSNYPDAHSIHAYCLGHTEFVSSVRVVPGCPDLLLSSSGDGTVKCWEFKSGTELSSRLCYEDAGMVALEGTEKGDADVDDNDFKRKTRQTPAVKCIKTRECDDGVVVVVASIEGFNGVLSYSFDAATKSLEFKQKIEVGSLLWDVGFDSNANLWALESDKPFFSVFCRKEGNFILASEGKPKETPQVKQMLEEGKKLTTGLDDLYKRWFDNMKDYLEKKEKRLGQQQNGSNGKKVKV